VDQQPAWSPDGQSLAFVSDRNGDFDLYLIGAEGQGERLLLDRAGNEYEPCWSPDGARIACTVSMHGAYRDVLVVDPQTGTPEHPKGLTCAAKDWWPYTHIHHICWSPDGQRIAGAFEQRGKSGVFVACREPIGLQELVAVEPLKPKPGGDVPRYQLVGGWYWDGNASRRWLTRRFDSVEWSPDGRRIAFRSDLDPSGYDFLYTVGDDGRDLVRMEESLNPAGPDNRVSDGR
jgi:Tol biopolymer transport system component